MGGRECCELSNRKGQIEYCWPRQLHLGYIYLECGSNDPWLAEHRAWTKTAAAHDFHYEYRESPGKHDYAYWRETLRTLLPRVNDQLQRHHRDWQRNTSWEPLLGKWTSVAVIPDGELSFTTLFEIKDGRLSGQSEGGPDGVQTFDRIQFEDGSLNYRSYQRERIIEVRAEMTKEGTFVGEWIVANPQGQPAASGEWRASRTLTE